MTNGGKSSGKNWQISVQPTDQRLTAPVISTDLTQTYKWATMNNDLCLVDEILDLHININSAIIYQNSELEQYFLEVRFLSSICF